MNFFRGLLSATCLTLVIALGIVLAAQHPLPAVAVSILAIVTGLIRWTKTYTPVTYGPRDMWGPTEPRSNT